jgi:hypothetical protein
MILTTNPQAAYMPLADLPRAFAIFSQLPLPTGDSSLMFS